MKRSQRSSAAGLLLPAALTLASLAACSRCGTREAPAPAAPSGPSGPAAAAPRAPLPMTTPATAGVLATLDLPPAPAQAAPTAAPPPVPAHGAGGPPATAEPPVVESTVSPTGTTGAFAVRIGDTVRVHHAGTVSPPYENVARVTPSPDGKRLAFVARAKGKVHLVLDGSLGPAFDAVEGLVFTRDSRHLCYKVRTGEAWQVGCGRTLGPRQARIVGDAVVGADGKTLYAVERATKEAPYQVAAYDASLRRKVVKEIVAAEVMLSEDATSAAALLLVGRRKQVVTFPTASPASVKEGPWFDEITMVGFDRSGKHAAYGALRGDQAFLVMDGKEEPLPSKNLLEVPVPSPAGGSAGVLLAAEMAFFHLGFTPDPPKEKKYHSAREVTFSPDGKHYAYVGEDPEGSKVVVDGREGPAFDVAVLPVFSPDSRFLLYRAQRGAERFMVVADATGQVLRRHPAYEEVFYPTFPDGGTTVAYAVKDGPRLLWVTEKL